MLLLYKILLVIYHSNRDATYPLEFNFLIDISPAMITDVTLPVIIHPKTSAAVETPCNSHGAAMIYHCVFKAE